MRKKTADHSKVGDILEKEYKKIFIKDDNFNGAACLLKISKVKQDWYVPRAEEKQEKIMGENYKWLGIYPKGENYSIQTIFDENNNHVEFYFDIAKKVKYRPKVPYIDDLYLDIVLTKENEVIYLDEEELKQALEIGEIGQKEYDLAKRTADKIINRYHRPESFENLKNIVNNYLEELENK